MLYYGTIPSTLANIVARAQAVLPVFEAMNRDTRPRRALHLCACFIANDLVTYEDFKEAAAVARRAAEECMWDCEDYDASELASFAAYAASFAAAAAAYIFKASDPRAALDHYERAVEFYAAAAEGSGPRPQKEPA